MANRKSRELNEGLDELFDDVLITLGRTERIELRFEGSMSSFDYEALEYFNSPPSFIPGETVYY